MYPLHTNSSYRINNKIESVCKSDDTVEITENEGKLQMLLYMFKLFVNLKKHIGPKNTILGNS